RDVSRAAALGRPFYAGIAAYGYALHFSRDGRLLAVYGDLDPAAVAASEALQQVDRHQFGVRQSGELGFGPAEWRYTYGVTQDARIEGIEIRHGESLVLDVPNAAALRAQIRAVRERGGDALLGICIFRLPEHDDATALTIEEVAGALNDQPPDGGYSIEARQSRAADGVEQLDLTFLNHGTSRTQLGAGAASLLVPVPSGALEHI